MKEQIQPSPPTPYFVIDAAALERNLRVLHGIEERTGARVLLASKCFSCYALFPLVARYLHGITASGLYEARLAREEMEGGEVHVFSPAYRPQDMEELLRLCDHVVFNSPRQLALYAARAREAGVEVGLRVNPECSTQLGPAIYDPCSPGSRLGYKRAHPPTPSHRERGNGLPTWAATPPPGGAGGGLLSGLHFHTLCEQDADALATTLDAVERQWGDILPRMKWINFGGGHHITRPGYNIALLERCIRRMQERYGLTVYLEPGEAVALNAGELHARVLEVQPRGADGVSNVILDTSAACHMPDVLEMPYTPPVISILHGGRESFPAQAASSSEEDTRPRQLVRQTPHAPSGAASFAYAPSGAASFAYRLGGPTCLAGDVIGQYEWEEELHEGDEVVFGDMAIYTMVKTNTFNGMPLPDIYIKEGGATRLWKRFGYDDFKRRL